MAASAPGVGLRARRLLVARAAMPCGRESFVTLPSTGMGVYGEWRTEPSPSHITTPAHRMPATRLDQRIGSARLGAWAGRGLVAGSREEGLNVLRKVRCWSPGLSGSDFSGAAVRAAERPRQPVESPNGARHANRRLERAQIIVKLPRVAIALG